MSIVSLALAILGAARPSLAAPNGDGWTPDRVRDFVIRVEAQMVKLSDRQLGTYVRDAGTCRGWTIRYGIEKSVALPRIQALVTGRALTCYVASYLGCSAGDWIAGTSNFIAARSPFTRSKVTIIEQTKDRVVADVAETTYPGADDFVATVALDEDDEDDEHDDEHHEQTHRPFTDAEVAAVKDVSRYTITRGADGVWRISDRQPSFDWICKDIQARPPKDKNRNRNKNRRK
jgi:hypothetical protein